jgi:hypothetical protein
VVIFQEVGQGDLDREAARSYLYGIAFLLLGLWGAYRLRSWACFLLPVSVALLFMENGFAWKEVHVALLVVCLFLFPVIATWWMLVKRWGVLKHRI